MKYRCAPLPKMMTSCARQFYLNVAYIFPVVIARNGRFPRSDGWKKIKAHRTIMIMITEYIVFIIGGRRRPASEITSFFKACVSPSERNIYKKKNYYVHVIPMVVQLQVSRSCKTHCCSWYYRLSCRFSVTYAHFETFEFTFE